MATKTKHASWAERVKWAEEQGLKNLAEKFATADSMSKEAQTTLTYVMAGMGGTFAYVFPNLDKPLTPVLWAALVLCGYFTLLGIALVVTTFFIKSFPSPYAEPNGLLARPDLSIEEVREGEVDNITDRITDSINWIDRKSKAVNLVRGGLVASPLVGAIAIWACKRWG
jgi:hypothetical protein